jgi:hypothetical protein
MKDNEKKDKPTIAPGMDDYEDLKQDATEEEKNGEYISVTTLSLDEVDPS